MSISSSHEKSDISVQDTLQRFCGLVLQNPSSKQAVATWNAVENRLRPEHQARLLVAWNKHLTGVNKPNEVAEAVDEIIRDLDEQ